MSVDFTKPIRIKLHPQRSARFLGVLEGQLHDIAIAVAYENPRREVVDRYSECELENIPQSRWLNVYAFTGEKEGVCTPIWVESKEFSQYRQGPDCLGMLEDKQDGSPYIFHPKT